MSSYIKKSELKFDRGIVEATLTLDLRVADLDLIKKYGPAKVNYGGDIEYTLDYQTAVELNLYPEVPSGDPEPTNVQVIYHRSDDYRILVDDVKVTMKFSLPNVEVGKLVAEQWYVDKIAATRDEIDRIRDIDPGVIEDRSLVEI